MLREKGVVVGSPMAASRLAAAELRLDAIGTLADVQAVGDKGRANGDTDSAGATVKRSGREGGVHVVEEVEKMNESEYMLQAGGGGDGWWCL